MPISLHGFPQLRQHRLSRFPQIRSARLPQHDQTFFSRFAVNSLRCRPFPHRRRLRGQDTDRVFAVISRDLRELVQDQFLGCPICDLIALANCRCQLSTRRQLNFSPHLRLPACRLCSMLGSILDEATTHYSVANIVSQALGRYDCRPSERSLLLASNGAPD